jgi:hypothetical protein
MRLASLKKTALVLPIAALLLAVQPGDARAQVSPVPGEVIEAGIWTVTPFIGPSFGGDLENTPLSLGLATAYNWTDRVAFEGEFGFLRAAEQGVLVPFDTSVYTFSGNVLYHFAVQDWAPYVTVGLGLAHARADLEGLPIFDVDENSTELALNFGGGLKANLTDQVRFRGDLRYFNGNDLAPDFLRLYAGLQFLLGR